MKIPPEENQGGHRLTPSRQGWAKTQNLEKTQKTRVFLGFLGFSQGFFKCGFFQDVS